MVRADCLANPAPDGTACALDTDQCTLDVCASGVCTHPVAPDGTACNDGAVCTGPDTCTAGVCAGPVLCRNVAMPLTSYVGPNADQVVPITVDASTGVTAMDFTLTYNPAVVTPTSVTRTGATNAFTLTSDLSVSGEVRASLSGATAPAGAAEVAWVVFRAAAPAGSSSSLLWTRAVLNGGALSVTPAGGAITVAPNPTVLSMPDDANGAPGWELDVPVRVEPAADLLAFDITILFNPAVLHAVSVSTTPATDGWTLTTNTQTDGRVNLSLFNPTPLTGGAVDIALVRFHVTGAVGDRTPLDIVIGRTNDNVPTTLDDGFFTVCADADADGWTACGGDCDDARATVHPGAPELCDGRDNDCGGQVDEAFRAPAMVPGLGDACTNGLGVCVRPGVYVCNGSHTGIVCDAVPGPAGTETCNNLDDDCDGAVDETPAEVSCQEAPADNPCTADTCAAGVCGRANSGLCDIDGYVYYNRTDALVPPPVDSLDQTRPVRNVRVVLNAGPPAYTDASGHYRLLRCLAGRVDLPVEDRQPRARPQRLGGRADGRGCDGDREDGGGSERTVAEAVGGGGGVRQRGADLLRRLARGPEVGERYAGAAGGGAPRERLCVLPGDGRLHSCKRVLD